MANVLETVRADDFVEYFIFPVKDGPSASDKLVDLLNKILSFSTPIIGNYIWHKDEFNLCTNAGSQPDDCPPHLHGITHYGENIDDEWFVVYILKKISEQFDVFVRVIDSDGEFLLIEAADHLPKWIKSNNSDQRVYLRKDSVRILPPDVLPNNPSVNQIIKRLNRTERVTDVEQTVTKCIDGRIQKFSNLKDLLHRSRAYVPAKIAALLDANPSLIASAVTTFCQRDIIDKRICRKNEHFPPDDKVLRLVTFTKFLYAMISHEKLKPERNNWNFPPPSDPRYKEYQLGYKIACGFEILASKCSKKSQSDLTLSKKWNQYVQVLKRKGYFKDLLEGSKEYVDLERKARVYFLDNVGIEDSDHKDLLNILQTVNCDVDKLKLEESELPPSDDEKWMEINEEEFNKLLESRFGLKGVNLSNTPEALSLAINKFLNCASDVEGVEIKSNKPLNQFSTMDIDEETRQNISFNPDDFVSSVEKMLDIMELRNGTAGAAVDDSDADSDDSKDYQTESENEDASEDLAIKSYMDLMDKELKSSTLSKSFVTESDDESSKPVDIDMNAMAHILKSYEEQCGGSGPAGNLLHSMGLKLDTRKGQ